MKQVDVYEIAAALHQLLDDMGKGGLCVCLYAKARARIAIEPFRGNEDFAGLISLDEARRIVAEAEVNF